MKNRLLTPIDAYRFGIGRATTDTEDKLARFPIIVQVCIVKFQAVGRDDKA